MRKIGFILAAIALSSSAVSAAPPILGVSPTYMEFTATAGEANPDPNILSIWRDGGNGPLNWTVTEDCNWIVVEPNSGKSTGEVDDCNIIADINSLVAGIYSCQLTVDAGTAANSPQIVDVNLTVMGPNIALSATYFEFTAYEGGANPDDQTLTITNSGAGTLNWQVAEDCNWLSAEPNSGSSTGEADDVNLSIDITGLTGGTYNCQLTVSDPNSSNSPQFVDVNLVIQPWTGWDGNGTADDPYLIYTAAQMNYIGTDANYWDAHFKLMADIDLIGFTDDRFNIIGSWGNEFSGVFDGNGHTISNFTYITSSEDLVGIFGVVTGSGALIRDLGIRDPNVDVGTGEYAGSLVGLLGFTASITDCNVVGGRVAGNSTIGGMVGCNPGSISDCFSDTVVSGSRFVGVLVGENPGGRILCCYAAGTVFGTTSDIGGLAGYNSGEILQSYSTANISGTADSAGGLVGWSWGEICDSYATGSISAGNYVGGLAGWNWDANIVNCYSTGFVSGTGGSVGGLLGKNDGDKVTACFWDTQTSGQPSVGVGSGSSNGVYGKTTSQMRTESTFTDMDWDFNTPIWDINEGVDYPKLVCKKYGGGKGTVEEPYLIYTAEQMSAIGSNYHHFHKHFRLMADIDLSTFTGSQFNIIGYYNSSTDYAPFTGSFDGNGHKISNFTYISPGESMVGLFGYASGKKVEIRDLELIDPNVYVGPGYQQTGALAGLFMYGSIRGCCVTGGTIKGDFIVGGLVGRNAEGTISNCHSTASIKGTDGHVGGLIGRNEEGTITECYTTGPVEGSSWDIGGLIGDNSVGFISRCYSSSEVDGNGFVGGLVGSNPMTLPEGFYGEISDCYASGTVTGNDYIGGFAGGNVGKFFNCYAVGSVVGSGSGVGGLVGGSGGVAYNSFWDVNSTGQTSSSQGTPKTTSQMQTISTFTDGGWDFIDEVINGPNDIWRLCIDGIEYPKLSWEFLSADFTCPDGVTLPDFSILASAWYTDPCLPNWNPICDISEPNDNVIDESDVMVFTDNWLAGL